MLNLNYKNRYGSVTFRPVSNIIPVKDIRGVNIDDRYKFDIDTGEKIALITDNRGIQLCPTKCGDRWRIYVVLHATPSTAAVAEIIRMDYTGGDPRQEIIDARRYEPLAPPPLRLIPPVAPAH